MRIGAHVSTAGGADLAIDRAVDIGAEAVQIFASPPQGWAFKPLDELVVSKFKTKALENGIGPNVFHGIYLVSLGADDEALVSRSKKSLISYMNAAHDLGIMGVIFHLGSHKGRGYDACFDQLCSGIREVLDNSPDDSLLILENSAGMGNHIGSKFAELGRVVRAIDDPRVQICLDTQHSFAAGYDLTTPEGVATAMDEFEREIGADHLVAVHCNDSKPPLGGAVDRHENIGEGQMGLAAFEAVLAHPAFRDVPFYLEVPGFEGKGPDARNVQTIKDIRDRLTVPA
ncbi:MAG: deoxyribonuclease IV [Dehalococcoidia bacterium]